jgi:pimeloyl-ACP methyl ester carboxylesterase
MNDEITSNRPTSLPSVEMMLRDDGRRLAVHRLTHGDGERVLVLCHIAPGSGTFDPEPQQTRARRVTLLAPDRPGYGQSDPMPKGEWASVRSAADDLAAMLDRKVDRPVGVAGWSAGGRVALALAARRPDLVDRVVVLGTPAPNDQVPWIPPEQQTALESLRGRPPDEVRAVLSKQLAQLNPQNASAADMLSLVGASDADSTVLAAPGARARLLDMLQAAFAQGTVGLASDMAGYCLQPWGFEPEDVQAKTLLLYGSRDPIAPPPHGRWWQKQLPNARLEVVPDGGHLLIVPMWQRVLSHLAPNTKR